MRKPWLKIRFWLIPVNSRREQLYHDLRLTWQVASSAGKRKLIQFFPVWRRVFIHTQPGASAPRKGEKAYQRWIRRNDPGKSTQAQQLTKQAAYHYRPQFSILVFLDSSDPACLGKTIHSIQAQTYPVWELCQVVDSKAISEAQGDYVILMNPGDCVSPTILSTVVNRLDQYPDIDIIYFDEDRIASNGRRHSPWFKPSALSPDLLLSANYLGHPIIRRSLLQEAGCIDLPMHAVWDWDIALRLLEKTSHIQHIPQVLYHQRQTPDPVSCDPNASSALLAAQTRTVQAHLNRLGYPQASVESSAQNLVHVHWPVSGKKVSIIIPTKDNLQLLQACLKSIVAKTSYPDYEILLIDTGSCEPATQDYYQTLSASPNLKLLTDPNPFNFHRVCNLGARQAIGEILIFLNNDTEVLHSTWLEELVGWVERPEVGIAGALLIRPAGTIQHAGLVIGLAGHASQVFDGGQELQDSPFGSSAWYRDYQAVTGACLAVRREVFEQLSGFDEAYQVGYGDIDLCLRAVDAGYLVVYNPFARLLHHEGATRGLVQPPSDVLRASVSMYPRIQTGDPYFNPHLSRFQRIPALAYPGEAPASEMILRILRSYDLIANHDLESVDPQRWQVQLPIPFARQANQTRLLVISHELNRSGAPIILWKLCHSLAMQGYQITVLSPSDGLLHEAYINDGITVHIIPSLLSDARVVLPYCQDQDLVLANTILSYRIVHAAKAANIPVLFWIHESDFGQQLCRRSPAAASAIQQADQVIFPSKATAALYHEFAVPGKFTTIHIGIEGTSPNPPGSSAQSTLSADKFNIVVVASVEIRKGQDILLHALELLPPEISSQVECFLIGPILYSQNNKYCHNLIKQAKRMGNVYLLGDTPPEQVRQVLSAADVFILPSRDEALPISILEAMSYGKAIIAANVGGISEILQDQVNGILVEKEDPGGLAEAIKSLYLDKNTRYNLGEAARHTFQDSLIFDKFLIRFQALIHDVLVTVQ